MHPAGCIQQRRIWVDASTQSIHGCIFQFRYVLSKFSFCSLFWLYGAVILKAAHRTHTKKRLTKGKNNMYLSKIMLWTSTTVSSNPFSWTSNLRPNLLIFLRNCVAKTVMQKQRIFWKLIVVWFFALWKLFFFALFF